MTSGSVGVEGGGGNNKGAGTSGTSEAVGTGVVGAVAGGTGTSGAVLAVAGGGDGCGTVEGGDGPGSGGVTEENWRRNCLFLSVTLPLPSTLTLYLL